MDRAREKPVGYSPRLCSSSSSSSSLLVESALHAIEASSHPPRLQPAARRRRRQARRSSDDEDAKTARAARERLMLLAATALTPRSPRTSTRSRSEAAHTAAGVARDGIGAPPWLCGTGDEFTKTELEHSATHFT